VHIAFLTDDGRELAPEDVTVVKGPGALAA
jgi:hypothetical protein